MEYGLTQINNWEGGKVLFWKDIFLNSLIIVYVIKEIE